MNIGNVLFKTILYSARVMGVIGVLGIPLTMYLALTLPLNIVQAFTVLLFIVPFGMLVSIGGLSFDRHLTKY